MKKGKLTNKRNEKKERIIECLNIRQKRMQEINEKEKNECIKERKRRKNGWKIMNECKCIK